MHSSRVICTLALFGLVAFFPPAAAQADPFQNLNFEQAFSGAPYYGTPPSGPFITLDSVPGAAALPYWSWNGVPGTTTNISYNNILLDGPDIAIWRGTTGPYYGVLGGQYSLMLSDWNQGAHIVPHDVSISQTGTVPSYAQSVHFTVSIDDFDQYGDYMPSMTDEFVLNNLIQLSLNGVPITLASTSPANVIIQDGTHLVFHGEVAGAVSSFAGQDALLKLLAAPNAYFGVDEGVMIDNIYFSPLPVPEPSSLLLAVAGALGLAAIARRRRRRA